MDELRQIIAMECDRQKGLETSFRSLSKELEHLNEQCIKLSPYASDFLRPLEHAFLLVAKSFPETEETLRKELEELKKGTESRERSLRDVQKLVGERRRLLAQLEATAVPSFEGEKSRLEAAISELEGRLANLEKEESELQRVIEREMGVASLMRPRHAELLLFRDATQQEVIAHLTRKHDTLLQTVSELEKIVARCVEEVNRIKTWMKERDTLRLDIGALEKQIKDLSERAAKMDPNFVRWLHAHELFNNVEHEVFALRRKKDNLEKEVRQLQNDYGPGDEVK